MNYEILIQNGKSLLTIPVEDGMKLVTDRVISPARLQFAVIDDGALQIEEGNTVRLRIDNAPMFFGFIFSIRRNKSNKVEVLAYDQIRYLKNSDTLKYVNKRPHEVLRMLIQKCNLQAGTIENTSFTIRERIEENTTYSDMIQNAYNEELLNRGKMYVIYDDFGKITAKSIENMKVPVVIDTETGENFNYNSSIDDKTYNQIKLRGENGEIYIAKDSSNINQWGLLQYFDTIDEGVNGKAKVDSLLRLYNSKVKTLSVNKAFGHTSVRAGSLVIVGLNVGDLRIHSYMLVESCTHEFGKDSHFMNLKLRGGEVNA
jgi:hypothetical protein